MKALHRFAIAGALLGALVAPLLFAPATWLAQGLAAASDDHLLLTETRGTLWSGSGLLVLSGGAGSRSASVLPGRVMWALAYADGAFELRARQDCCINRDLVLRLKPGWKRLSVSLPDQTALPNANAGAGTEGQWLARWPAAWLEGLGTPWNTLQLTGALRLSAQGFKLDYVDGKWQPSGRLAFDFVNVGSRLSTLAPLGSYRLTLSSVPGEVSTLTLNTLDGALLINGQGSIGAGGTHFQGVGTAAPEREEALNNLLNIIGRRDGARSVISIG